MIIVTGTEDWFALRQRDMRKKNPLDLVQQTNGKHEP